ncbi:hypothetical protein RAZWK3B_15403 [Roseobacter sp. AzwK-3b]|uniref:hypothetical protein n=1 Tax=Roseobacter sp. AzwK-3b TaxID=351016 RepID=UPI000156A3BA|nr:hypothetical protein [Roseobacter sp. AzwK-3b]EDM70796.1 hypothetical protein RAZWK3B_15403 [Roseobacter sp. AzwK-3b]
MSDDLVKRLRAFDCITMEGCGDDLRHAAADRIEGLEAELREARMQSLSDLGQAHDAYQARLEAETKLAKAVGALGDIYDGEPEWPDDPKKELDWCRNRARATLAELEAEKDKTDE